MKTKNILTTAITLIVCLYAGLISYAQEHVYISAMKEEVKRSMEGLILDRMLPPGYISYQIVDARTYHIKSVLGGIVKSDERRMVKFINRTLVIEDGISNENFIDMDNLWSWSRMDDNIPLSGNKDDIRRVLWLATDKNYKDALITYESKISAMNQQNLSIEEKELPDLLPADQQEISVPFNAMEIDHTYLIELVKNLSLVFNSYPTISASEANLFIYDAEVFFYNSEGSLAKYPFQVAAVLVTATAQAPSGEQLFEHSFHFAKDLQQLLLKERLLAEVKNVAENLHMLTQIASLTEPYSGPVLFEGQAAAEVFAQVLFGKVDGLIAVRKPIVGNEQILRFAPDRVKENSLEARIGRRVMSRDITIEALPQMNSYNGNLLFGSFSVDAEGIPSKEVVSLVDKGVLTGVLSSRVPTLKIRESNAHARLALNMASLKTIVAPGVIRMSVDDEASYDMQELKDILLREAKDEGLDYAYIVRKVVSPAAKFQQDDGMIILGLAQQQSDLSKLISVYRVYVDDGREEPVSLAEIKGLNIRSFRKLLGASSQTQVYNTMFQPANQQLYGWGFDLTGTPVSYIVPQALLFEELDLVKESQMVIKKPPIVENPVGKK